MKRAILIASLTLNIILIGYLFMKNTTEIDEKAKEKNYKNAQIIDEKSEILDTVNIVMLGNSITYQGDWQKVLGRNDVFNGGKPGWTTQQLSWVIKDFIVPYKPKICFFKGGINDYTLGISTARIFENMKMIMDSIHAVGTKPIYTTTLYQRGATERNLKIDTLNSRMQEFCTMKGYDFVDLRPFLCKDGDILNKFVQSDNTHLNPEAYPEWAKAIKPLMLKYTE